MKNKKAILLVAVCLIASVAIGALLSVAFSKKVERTVTASVREETKTDNTLTKDGVVFKPDTSVRSYLFLGVDDAGLDYEAYGRGGRTDTILLLVKKGETLHLVEISRDTMTEVDTYDTAGDYLSSGVMQLNMQYSFGDSPRRSAYLTRRTVSKLLRGADIGGSVALDMSGIAPIVDELGGITVHMEEDCSYIDPSYTAGAEVSMDGQAAERFIRWRDTDVTGGNDARMNRHAWFIRQMLEQTDGAGISALLQAADPYLHTDMTAEEIKALYDCTLSETIRLPGETKSGAAHDEFYVDEDGLTELLLKLYYYPTGTE